MSQEFEVCCIIFAIFLLGVGIARVATSRGAKTQQPIGGQGGSAVIHGSGIAIGGRGGDGYSGGEGGKAYAFGDGYAENGQDGEAKK